MRVAVLLLAWTLIARSAVHAQSLIAPGRGQWTIAVYLGSSSGGPSRDLEAAMVSGGYTDPFGGCDIFICVPESPSPSAYSHANPLLLSIRYRMRGPYGAELLVGQSASGTVSGRRESEILNVEYGGTLIAPVASVGSRKFQLGIGPALLRGSWTYHNTSDGSRSRESSSTLGWLGMSTLALPIGPVFQVQATAQYRGFGDARVRGARINGAHWYVAAGVGIAM